MASPNDRIISRNTPDQLQVDGLADRRPTRLALAKFAVLYEHVALLKERFSSTKYKPSFAESLEGIQQAGAESQAAPTSSTGRYSTLAVWAWENGFDLSRVPQPEQAVDLVTIQASEKQTIALKLTKRSEHWDAGEVIVFEAGHREQVDDGEICLVQVRTSRGAGSKTMIARARVARAKRGKAIQFDPVSPVGAVFAAENEDIIAVLSAIYRGRRLK